MADIVITFPKKPKSKKRFKPQIDYFRTNIDGVDYFVYKIGCILPSKSRLKKGDRCHIGFENTIHGYYPYLFARYVSDKEAKKIRKWDGTSGTFLFCDHNRFRESPEPKPRYRKGFPGFRYYVDEVRKGNITSGNWPSLPAGQVSVEEP